MPMTPDPHDAAKVEPHPTLGPEAAPTDDALGMRLSPTLERAAERLRVPPTTAWPDPSSARAEAGRVSEGPDRPMSFGNYELLREVGRGGMGVVYKARQRALDRLVAVKMILGSHLANADQVDRFYAEARAAALLRDPHVVAIHDVGEIYGQHYFAMEFIEGPSLAQRLNEGPIAIEEVVRLVATVARAVGRLHARGVIHRDLKPSNILLDARGCPFVTDFGLAKMFSATGPRRTPTRSSAPPATWPPSSRRPPRRRRPPERRVQPRRHPL
jgi:serine/threonine protein kinase